MSHSRRHRKSLLDEFFGGSIFNEFEKMFSDLSREESASGYSISVVQTPEGTRVKAKVGKNVDVNALKRRLKQQYPGAKIEIEGGRQEPLIKEISTKTINDEEKS